MLVDHPGLAAERCSFNAVVDPYACVHGLVWTGLNRVKPAAAQQGAMAKTCQMRRAHARTLVLGNSRAEVGLDPTHPAWPVQPVYNAALPGTGTEVSLGYLQRALGDTQDGTGPPLKVVMWGLDFMDFLVDPTQPPTPAPAEIGALSSLNPMPGGTAAWVTRGHALLASTLTLAALLDSMQTLASQRDPDAVDLRPTGFNPMREYRKISREEGYWSLFRQKDLGNMASYMRRPNGIFDASGRGSPAWADLQEVLRLCRQHGIVLYLFTYPYHAHLLETMRLTGHWQALEAWKRTLVQVLADEAQRTGQPAFAFWDFIAFNDLTTEPVPARADRSASMRWYWEAGHFKSALGGLMLERMFATGLAPMDFGVQLTRDNLQDRWNALLAQEQAYRCAHPQDMQGLNELLVQSSPLRAR